MEPNFAIELGVTVAVFGVFILAMGFMSLALRINQMEENITRLLLAQNMPLKPDRSFWDFSK